jgi:hypothetical protein
MRYLETRISLPPRVLPTVVVHRLLRLAFDEFRWFVPVKYGRASLEGRVVSGRIDYGALLEVYDEYKDLTITARTDRDFLFVWSSRAGEPPYTGTLAWCTSAREALKPAWREAHLLQVMEVMQLVGSPFAYAGIDEDLGRKRNRRMPAPDGLGEIETFTVRDPSEGLAGLFWRNFYGLPFTRLFGERLATLPPDTRQELGNGLVLVQPYALPAQAGTPEGEARERELIAHLGPGCFYDHERHLKPTQLPELTR